MTNAKLDRQVEMLVNFHFDDKYYNRTKSTKQIFIILITTTTITKISLNHFIICIT